MNMPTIKLPTINVSKRVKGRLISWTNEANKMR